MCEGSQRKVALVTIAMAAVAANQALAGQRVYDEASAPNPLTRWFLNHWGYWFGAEHIFVGWFVVVLVGVFIVFLVRFYKYKN
jgi:hypothetical protein